MKIMEHDKIIKKFMDEQKNIQATGVNIDVVNFKLGVHTVLFLRQWADDIEGGKVEISESQITIDFTKGVEVQELRVVINKLT